MKTSDARAACRRGRRRAAGPAKALTGTLVAACANLGCAGLAGRAVEPPAMGPTVTSVSTSEDHGLRVLWNGRRRGPIDRRGGWLASTPDDLVALWREAGVPAPVPQVDFARDVVVGFAASDGPCSAEIARAVTDGRTVRLQGFVSRYACEDVLIGVAQVVTLPRRILGRRAVVVPVGEWGAPGKSYAFDVPAPRPTPPPRDANAPVAARAPALPPESVVPLPPPGHVALEAVADGIEVWVVHRADDSVSVLASTLFDELGLGHALWWAKEDGRLGSFDSHGHDVDGDAPMPGYAFRRLPDERLVVLAQRAPAEGGPIEARDRAPVLDGPDRPYTSLPVVTRWADIPEGRLARFDADVVFSKRDVVRLCSVPPRARSESEPFDGCPPDAPRVSPAAPLKAPLMFGGPILARRRGNAADFVVVEKGYGGYGTFYAKP